MKRQLLIETLKKVKPTKSFWGIFSVIMIFITPEIIAFIWGADIKSFTDAKVSTPLPLEEELLYKALGELLGEGSWLNLIIGIAILIWAFF